MSKETRISLSDEEVFSHILQNVGHFELWQAKLASILTLPRAMRPPKEKTVALLGLGNVTNYDNWARHPKVQQIKAELTKLHFKDVIPDILFAMQNSALMGDVSAAKLFLSYVDEWDTDSQKQINNTVNVTPDQLGDILKNLKDKDL